MVQKINKWTDAYDIPPGDYTETMTIEDPNRNIRFEATFPQVVKQLVYLYQEPSQANLNILRANF